VVERPSDAPERFSSGAEVIAGGEPARVVESKRAGGRLVIRLDRPVERGAFLEVPRSALAEPDPDSYYVFQLVGLAVEDEGGHALGRVVDVVPGIANDVVELDSGASLPLVESCVRRIDLSGGRMVIAAGYADPV
jgi:16S rRNA processing protein RimM